MEEPDLVELQRIIPHDKRGLMFHIISAYNLLATMRNSHGSQFSCTYGDGDNHHLTPPIPHHHHYGRPLFSPPPPAISPPSLAHPQVKQPPSPPPQLTIHHTLLHSS